MNMNRDNFIYLVVGGIAGYMIEKYYCKPYGTEINYTKNNNEMGIVAQQKRSMYVKPNNVDVIKSRNKTFSSVPIK